MPDIYDSAKYDAIHNSELGLDIQELYMVRHTLSSSARVYQIRQTTGGGLGWLHWHLYRQWLVSATSSLMAVRSTRHTADPLSCLCCPTSLARGLPWNMLAAQLPS